MEVFFQWLIERWQSLYIVYLVRPYERVVHIRGGKLLKVSKPGWYFKRPLEYDEIHKINVVYETVNLRPQVVTDKNGATYIVSSVIGWQAHEESCEKLILSLEDYSAVIVNTAYGELARSARLCDLSGEVRLLEDSAATAIRRKLGRYGVDLKDLWITDLAKARTYRLVTGDS